MLSNKIIIITLATLAIIIIVSGNLREDVIYCIQAPCPQSLSYVIGKIIYSFLTFNGIFSNNTLALQIKNMLQPNLSAGTVYFWIDFIGSMMVYSVALAMMQAIRRKPKTSKK